jgi:hypothetical protein
LASLNRPQASEVSGYPMNRVSALVRSYPRVGVPPQLRSYWEVRPHPRFGTLEVRVMDAQPSLRHAVGLVALVQGLVRYAVENPVAADLPATP